jgi:hypothetical protein
LFFHFLNPRGALLRELKNAQLEAVFFFIDVYHEFTSALAWFGVTGQTDTNEKKERTRDCTDVTDMVATCTKRNLGKGYAERLFF